jgi:predicted PurR-regulated permease PerM
VHSCMSDRHRAEPLLPFAIALGLFVAYQVRHVLLLIYVSALFAVVFGPVIELIGRVRIGRWHPSRGFAVLIIIAVALAVAALVLAFLVPSIIRDAEGLAADWPRRAVSLFERLSELPIAGKLEAGRLEQYLSGTAGGVFSLLKGIAGSLFGFFSWLVLTAYFILDGDRAFRWAMSLFPSRHRVRLESTFLRAEQRLRKWLIGQAALMLILAISSAIVFGLLRIKYSYALSVFAGLANIVPILGPVVSVILAGIVAAFDSWWKLLGVVIFYLLYQQVENAFLTPRIMKSTLNLAPLAVIIALSLGGALAGVLGALISVPTAALIAVILDEYVVRKETAPAEFAASEA